MGLRNINVDVSVVDEKFIPQHAHASDAGFDFRIRCFHEVYSNDSPDGCPMLPQTQALDLKPGERVLIKVGVKIALPEGYELQIRPKSGLALKKGITVLNSPGTIDCSYRGEIGVIVINHGQRPMNFRVGMKIAQGVIAPHMTLNPVVVASLDETNRGEGGFGSTGS